MIGVPIPQDTRMLEVINPVVIGGTVAIAIFIGVLLKPARLSMEFP